MIHYTAMTSAQAAADWLCHADAQVSAHYVIGRRGTVWQLVDETQRAWHAGAGRWRDIDDVNSRSIGIELSNTGAQPFPEPQMATLETLLRGIFQRWNISPIRVIGHSDLAPGRKIDPGPRFDWRRLARQGLADWPVTAKPEPISPNRFRALAQQYGYTTDVTDETLLATVRSRFNPWVRGALCAQDMAVVAGLCGEFGLVPGTDLP